MQESGEQPAPAISEALRAANDLLISSLAAGPLPEEDPERLSSQIASYRASIQALGAQLQPLGSAPPDAAPAADGGAGGRDQQAAAGGGGDDAAAVGGLGREGVDYTVGSADDLDPSEWQVPPHCVPVHANVTTFDWPRLAAAASFDAVMMDPPWQLATANPTRGVALGYSQLTDADIRRLPVPRLQRRGGLLFVWVINSKYQFTLDLFDHWGYTLVDEIVWVKMTVNRRLAKSHGYYLQHAKEVCLVAVKQGGEEDEEDEGEDEEHGPRQDLQQQGALLQGQQQRQQQQQQLQGQGQGELPPRRPPVAARRGVASDVIFSERRGQSQKPEEVYRLIEELVPGGRYLEIFARKNNLRDFWVSIGNEVTGTGLPEEDMAAFKASNCIPGAVYGRGGGGGGGGGGDKGVAAAVAAK